MVHVDYTRHWTNSLLKIEKPVLHLDDDVIQTLSVTNDFDTVKNWSNTWAVDFNAN